MPLFSLPITEFLFLFLSLSLSLSAVILCESVSPSYTKTEAAAMQSSIERWVRGTLIGAGSFGQVSLAINLDNGELFAVKSIQCQSHHRSRRELESIQNELQILRSLDSPRVLRCLGSSYTMEEGVPIKNLFLEYMPGGSLADLTTKFGGKLDESLIRLYTCGILEGLEYLHNQGLVHCDIKGKNVLMGPGGVKLADFGSAKRLSDTKDKEGELKGTPLWMAPEVVQQVEQGPASDVWSLGCTVLEMATGRPPWTHSETDTPNAFAALYKIACTHESPLPSPNSLSLSPLAMDFLSHCLERDPKSRWTASQLLHHPFIISSSSSPPSSPTSILNAAPFDFRKEDVESLSTSAASPSTSTTPSLHSSPSSSWDSSCFTSTDTSSSASSSSSSSTSSPPWIAVHSPSRRRNSSQKPLSDLMLHPSSEKDVVVVKSGSEVNLDCFAFLRVRRQPHIPNITATSTQHTPSLDKS